MKLLRTLLIGLAMLAVALPLWDARGVVLTTKAPGAMQAVVAADAIQIKMDVQPVAKVKVGGRGACLSGAPCGPDMAPPPPALNLPMPPRAGAPQAEPPALMAKALGWTLRRPPRLI